MDSRRDADPAPMPPAVERLPATRGAEPLSLPLPELGALPLEDASGPAAAGPGAHPPAPPHAPAPPFASGTGTPPPPRRPGRLGRIVLAAVLVAGTAWASVAAFSLGDPDQPESAPGRRQGQQTRTAEPGSPSPVLPTATPSPRIAGSDPLPPKPSPTRTQAPPPSPTGPPRTTAPASPEPEPRPTFSWPSQWPTPSPCASGWCWGRDGGGNDPGGY